MENQILTSREASALLKIHPKTLQRLVRQGAIPGFRVGDLWRFRYSDLETWFSAVASGQKENLN